MMGAFGRFLEVSVPAPDVLRSLAFYRALGFEELPTGDIRRWHYAVVTDGAIAIGLHGDGVTEPTLAFVRPQLARQVQALEAAGQAFDFTRLGSDEFHEAALRAPDGQLILMLEARTFSPGGATTGAPLASLGRCREVTLACADVGATRAWFERAGFLPAEDADETTRLVTPGITLGLRAGTPRSVATLRFAARAGGTVLKKLAALGLAATTTAEGPALTAPEGTRLVIEG